MRYIICDIDGVLNHLDDHYVNLIKNGDYDEANIYANEVLEINLSMVKVIKSFLSMGLRVVFLTGRSMSFRNKTKQYLDRILDGCFYGSEILLVMRKDKRPSYQFKIDWIHCFVPKENIICLFDDKKEVIDEYLRFNLPAIWINNPIKKGLEINNPQLELPLEWPKE